MTTCGGKGPPVVGCPCPFCRALRPTVFPIDVSKLPPQHTLVKDGQKWVRLEGQDE